MATQTVTLRKYTISKGRESLYIQYYPPIRDRETMKIIQKEVLGIYLYKDPKDEFQKIHNKNMMDTAKLLNKKKVGSAYRISFKKNAPSEESENLTDNENKE